MYPTISDSLATPLLALARVLAANPGHLDRPECPYSPQLKEAIEELRLRTGGPNPGLFEGNPAPNHDPDLDVIEREVQELLNQVKVMSQDFGRLESNEKIQFIKGSTALWDKLISSKERTLNLKKMKEFQARVIDAMNEHLDDDQRKKVIDDLCK